LKTVGRVWNPKEIQDREIQQRMLVHMQAAERGTGQEPPRSAGPLLLTAAPGLAYAAHFSCRGRECILEAP
jgi:hypothetical protein